MMLVSLNEISQQQVQSTQNTLKKCNQLMDYAATYLNVFIRYHTHTSVVNGPSSWICFQLAVIASSDGVGRGPCPPVLKYVLFCRAGPRSRMVTAVA